MVYKMSMKLILAALCAGLISVSAQAQPKLDMVGGKFEFGYIPSSTVVGHAMWIRSIGSDTLVIDTITTGCVCATAPVSHARVAPGDSLEVIFYWDLKNRIGGVGVYPRIYTNVRPEPYYVHMTGTATRTAAELFPVRFEPFRLAFARTSAMSIDSLSFEVINDADHSIALTMNSIPPSQLEFDFPDSVAAGATEIGWVKVRPEYLEQEFQGSFTFSLSDKQEKPVTVPFHRKFFLPGVKSALDE